MKQQILKLINSVLRKYFSCNIVHESFTLDTHIEVWDNIRRIGINPDQIFDIGAARGEWTKELLHVFPHAQYLMFDPLKENEIPLKNINNSFPNVAFHCCALGEKNGEIEFNVHADQSSKFTSEWGGEKRIIPLRTLDSFLIESKEMKTNIMKIDVQGAELDVLSGASKILETCKVVQVEVSFRKVYNGAPLAHEIINFFSEKGFRIFDIASTFKRENDRALLQADVFFVSDNNLFKPETWK